VTMLLYRRATFPYMVPAKNAYCAVWDATPTGSNFTTSVTVPDSVRSAFGMPATLTWTGADARIVPGSVRIYSTEIEENNFVYGWFPAAGVANSRQGNACGE
jgi:hypothetical protein